MTSSNQLHRLYEVRDKKGKPGYYLADPDNKLHYPWFVPSSEHDALYVSAKPGGDELFGDYTQKAHVPGTAVTLSPIRSAADKPVSDYDRSIYASHGYGREVTDLYLLGAEEFFDLWRTQNPDSAHIATHGKLACNTVDEGLKAAAVDKVTRNLRQYATDHARMRGTIDEFVEQLQGYEELYDVQLE